MSSIRKILLLVAFGLVASMGPADAQQRDESGVLEPFRGDTPNSTLSINYGDYSAILKTTVLRTGHSDRRSVPTAAPAAGSRIVRGSKKSTRLEGNRIDFYAYIGKNKDVMKGLRTDIANVPSVLPLKDLTRNEQLAYWLNLYNITLITEVAEIFPTSSLKKFSKGKRNIWDKKVVTVAGVPLSLNDIQHKIIIPKYKNPLVMYGMFQGVIGGPNIRREAFTGREVWEQLESNAREFINSNRGAQVRYGDLRVSNFYKANAALFPNFNTDVRKHVRHYAKASFKQKITSKSKVKPNQNNWDVADVYGGSKSMGSAVSTNAAAFLGAFETGAGGGAAADYGGGAGGAIESAWVASMEALNMNRTRFPSHTIEYLHKKELRDRKTREGNVEIEEQDKADDQKKDGDGN